MLSVLTSYVSAGVIMSGNVNKEPASNMVNSDSGSSSSIFAGSSGSVQATTAGSNATPAISVTYGTAEPENGDYGTPEDGAASDSGMYPGSSPSGSMGSDSPQNVNPMSSSGSGSSNSGLNGNTAYTQSGSTVSKPLDTVVSAKPSQSEAYSGTGTPVTLTVPPSQLATSFDNAAGSTGIPSLASSEVSGHISSTGNAGPVMSSMASSYASSKSGTASDSNAVATETTCTDSSETFCPYASPSGVTQIPLSGAANLNANLFATLGLAVALTSVLFM